MEYGSGAADSMHFIKVTLQHSLWTELSPREALARRLMDEPTLKRVNHSVTICAEVIQFQAIKEPSKAGSATPAGLPLTWLCIQLEVNADVWGTRHSRQPMSFYAFATYREYFAVYLIFLFYVLLSLMYRCILFSEHIHTY